jgi:TMEM175 potassium channel family protein
MRQLYAQMNDRGPGRLEGFSDGVFAIAATLLTLEIGVDTSRGDLGGQLTRIWPSYLAYVTTFLIIGVIWINHHHCVSLLRRVDRTFLFINLLLLLTVAFMPFPTRLVAQYLQKSGERDAVIAYAATMLSMACVYNVWWRYARTGRRLIAEHVSDRSLSAVDRAFNPGVPSYAVVFAVAFVSPLASVVITLAIAVFYLPSAALFERGGEPA